MNGSRDLGRAVGNTLAATRNRRQGNVDLVNELRKLPTLEQLDAPHVSGEIGFSTPRLLMVMRAALIAATLVVAIAATVFVNQAAATTIPSPMIARRRWSPPRSSA